MAEHARAANGQLTGSPLTDDSDEDDTRGGARPAAEGVAARGLSAVSAAIMVGLLAVGAVGGVTAWLGYQAHQAHRVQQQRDLFISTARQAALNLTTISYTEADADVARILQSATGSFREDFQQRSQLFTDVVKHAQSTSVGTIIESGLESVDGDRAQVLVAASVKTSTPTSPTQENRSWRMRLTIATTEGAPKVANVQFVP